MVSIIFSAKTLILPVAYGGTWPENSHLASSCHWSLLNNLLFYFIPIELTIKFVLRLSYCVDRGLS